MREGAVGGGSGEQQQHGMEQGTATGGVGGQPHRPPGGEQQGPGRGRGGGTGAARAAAGGVWRRFASLAILAAIVVGTVLYYNRPPRIRDATGDGGRGGGGGSGAESIVTSAFDDGARQDATGGQPPPSPATIKPVPTNTTGSSSSTGGGGPSAAERLNLTGNAKAPSATQKLINATSGAAALNEKMKEALEADPELINLVDDGLFYQGKQISPELQCFPKDAAELAYYIEETDCVVVHLEQSFNSLDNPYRLERQINISHSIIIQGDSLEEPFIDCFDAVRCFRVLPGVYLTMRYVGINQGTGEYREAIPFLEGVPTTPTGMVLESRGGTVLFEPGALGGTFINCYFFDDMSGEEELELIIELNLNLVSVRIYGGFIFVGGGDIQFIGCLFYDYEIIATNDRIYLGGDVLVLAGEASFTGCVWIYSTWFAGEHGAGFNIAMLDGVSIFTFCEFNEFNAFLTTDGVGQAYMVVGGAQILTGLSLTYFTIGALFTGTGELTTFGGVQVATGVSTFDSYAVLASFGAGLDYFVGGGVVIHCGTAVNQYSGPVNSGMVGGYSYLGGGVYHATAASAYDLASTASEFGGGSVAWIGGGVATFIACPVVDVAGIGLGYFAGEYYYVGKGFMTWLFSPTIVFTAIDYFNGWGGFIFVGLGAALLGFSPTFQRYFITDEGRDYWIMGTCEPLPDTWAPQAPFLVTMNYAGPNSEGFRRCTNHTYPEGTFDDERRAQALLPGGGDLGQAAQSVGALAAAAKALGTRTPDQIGFSMFNSSKETLDFDDAGMMARLRKYGVQEDALRAGRMFAEAMAPFEKQWADRPKRPQPEPSLYVNSPVDGYCGVCGIEAVGGPGMGSCEYAESCDGFEAPPGYDGLVDFSSLEYKERFVILGSMESTSRPDVSSDPYLKYTAAGRAGQALARLRNADLEEALKAAVLASFDRIADGMEDPLHVSVWSSEPDPLFKDLFPAPVPSPAADAEFDTTHRHGISIITTSKANANQIIAALQAPLPAPTEQGTGEGTGPGRPAGAGRRERRRRRGQSEYVPEEEVGEGGGEGAEVAPGVVESYEAGTAQWGGGQKPGAEEAAAKKEAVETGVRTQMRKGPGIELGHVGLAYKKTLYIPPYNSKAMTAQRPITNLGPLTVVLQDPDMPSVPVKHVEYKKPYRIHIEQFPPNAKLHLQIVGVPENAQGLSALGTGAPIFKRTIAGSATGLGLNPLVTDAEGEVELEYRFRLLDAPAGDYSLQATDVATGMTGQSPLFLLSTQRRRRKLYGPIMDV